MGWTSPHTKIMTRVELLRAGHWMSSNHKQGTRETQYPKTRDSQLCYPAPAPIRPPVHVRMGSRTDTHTFMVHMVSWSTYFHGVLQINRHIVRLCPVTVPRHRQRINGGSIGILLADPACSTGPGPGAAIQTMKTHKRYAGLSHVPQKNL